MSLSKINDTPFYPITLPSTGERLKFRPFLVKEERALLTANESEDINTMYASLEAVVRNCLVPEPSKLTTFDIEYLFVHIRSKSVGETSDLILMCPECGTENEQQVNLKSVAVFTPPEHSKKIQLSDTIYATMKYPSVDELLDIQQQPDREGAMLHLVKSCIDSIFHGDDVYVIKEESDKEVTGFIDTLNTRQYQLLKQFVETIPYTLIKHSYKCKGCGKDNTVDLRGIFSFF